MEAGYFFTLGYETDYTGTDAVSWHILEESIGSNASQLLSTSIPTGISTHQYISTHPAPFYLYQTSDLLKNCHRVYIVLLLMTYMAMTLYTSVSMYSH